jgi:hypothetical protein
VKRHAPWALLVGVICLSMTQGKGWRPSPPVIPNESRKFVLDPAEVGAACAEATVRVNGVNRELLRRDQAAFFRRVRTALGDGAANTIYSLHKAGHLSVGDNEIFLPTAQLCRRADLPESCGARCSAAGYRP